MGRVAPAVVPAARDHTGFSPDRKGSRPPRAIYSPLVRAGRRRRLGRPRADRACSRLPDAVWRRRTGARGAARALPRRAGGDRDPRSRRACRRRSPAWKISDASPRQRTGRSPSPPAVVCRFTRRCFGALAAAVRDADVVVADSSAWAHHDRRPRAAGAGLLLPQPGAISLRRPRLPRTGEGAAGRETGARGTLRRVPRARTGGRRRGSTATSPIRGTWPRASAASTAARRASSTHRSTSTGSRGDPVAEPEPWFLVVSRLVPHKRVDLAIDACARAGVPLKVIGEGRSQEELERRAGPTVEFLGSVTDAAAGRSSPAVPGADPARPPRTSG